LASSSGTDRAASRPGRLTIVIPAYNEAATITAVLARVYAVALPIAREVIVVNDGSTDATRAQIEAVRASYPELIVLDMPRNSGKGAAIAHGVRAATGDVVVIQDADLEVHPAEHVRLLGPILEDGATVVYGSRFLGRRHGLALNILANRALTVLTNLLYGARISDMETAYKMVRLRSPDPGVPALRLRAGDHGQAAAVRPPHCRIAHLLHAALTPGGQEDQVAGRRRRRAGSVSIPLRTDEQNRTRLTTPRAPRS